MAQPKPTSGKRISVPLSVGGLYTQFGNEMQTGGMYSAGDAGAIPNAAFRSLSNILPQPNRMQVRPPFVYDSLMNINGLANFDDQTNQISRAVAIDTAHALYEKGTSGETWSSSKGTISGTRLTDYANYRGKLYGMQDNGSGLPSTAFSFDGTNTSTAPFNSTIAARTITAFNDRLFLGYPRVSVTNLHTAPYDWTNAAITHYTSSSAANVTSSGSTIGRVYVTATNGAKIEFWRNLAGIIVGINISASSTATPVVYRQDARCVSGSQGMPIKFEIIIVGPIWSNNGGAGTPWSAGNCIIDSNGALQRCTTAGTGGTGAAPAWATTLGATTTDAGATWTLEQAASSSAGVTIGLLDNQTIPANSGANPFTTYVTSGTVPPATNTLVIGERITFGTTTTPVVTTAAVDFSLKDGLTDGDPRKANYGAQVTTGDFYYPFYNQESSTTATIDMQQIVWSEIGVPQQIRAANTYNPWEIPGYITAACTIGGRYITFKRTGFFVFQGSADPDNPIIREHYDKSIGCLGPRAHDEHEDTSYFIGENEVYSYSVGDAAPTPLCGEGMREEILSRGSNWVESQSTYKRPLLVIDKTKLLLWVYTQKATLYCYDLRNQKWSKHTTPNSAEVDALLYNSNTGEVYVAYASGTYGLSRLDFTASQNDTIDNTANTYSVSADIIYRPIELYQPPRFDATLEDIHFYHAATASQSSQTCTAYYSTDQGTTFTRNEPVTLSPLSSSGEYLPVRLNALQTAPTVTVKLNHTGKAGAANWTISERAYANVNVRRGEYPTPNQTGGGANLVNP